MAQNQRLSTTLQLDAALTSGYKDAFNSAGDLMSDLKKQTTDLKKQINTLGKQADAVDKVGKSSKELRRELGLLERQVKETEKATEKFGEARKHFRSASIGARALKSDLGSIVSVAKTAALAITGIATAATVALSPDEELLNFDQTLSGLRFLAPEIDETGIDKAKSLILDLSNTYGTAVSEIAQQHEQLTRNLGFEGAQQTIQAAVEFQTVTGLSINEIEDELATARISLGIDTASETQEFLQLLQGAHRAGIKIDNIDLGDLETLMQRTGEDVFGDAFQREFLTTIAFRQVDSFQFADYAAAFQEEIQRAVLITPEMDTKAIKQAQESIRTLAKWGIRAEDGLVGAMQVYQELSQADRVQFFTELEPVLTSMPAEVIARGSEALPRIQQQVDLILDSTVSMGDAAEEITNSWSGAWGRIGTVAQNTRGILQQSFAETFGGVIVENAERFFDFVSSHQDEIQNFFTGIKDSISPVISRIWKTAKEAYPDLKQFATEVWQELKRQFDTVSPVLEWVTDKVIAIVKAVVGFVKEHPKLVATVLTGVIAWKAYRLATDAVKVGTDFVQGSIKMVQGHFHKLNAKVLENARLQGAFQPIARGTGQVLGNVGRMALSAIPGIGAMGTSMFAALAPALPIILPIVGGVAAIGAGAFIVYKNWEPISNFFSQHFETIRNALMIVFPPLGLLVGFAGVVKENWGSVVTFFKTIWETATLVVKVAFEAIQFVALSGLIAIKTAWASITSFFGDTWNAIRDFFLASPLAPIFAWMMNGVQKVVSPLLNFFGDFWNNVSDMAGRAINWIIEKFQFVNSVLDKAFGWLKKENNEMKAELGIKTDAPTLEVDAVDIPDVDIPESIDIANPSIDTPSIETPILESPSIATPSVEMPESPEVPTPAKPERSSTKTSAHGWDLVKIGLGQLKEVTKQTELLQNISPLNVIPEIPGQSNMLEANPFEGVMNVDIAPVAIGNLDTPAKPIEPHEMTFDTYVPPPTETQGRGDSTSETTNNTSVAPKIEVNNTFNITAHPGIDIDELTAAITEKVKASIEQETETYYSQ